MRYSGRPASASAPRAAARIFSAVLAPMPGSSEICSTVAAATASATILTNYNVDIRQYGPATLPTIADAVNAARSLAERGRIVVFGVKPDRAETGYGYIECGAVIGDDAFEVTRFVEKPPREQAEKYISAGGFLWNAGMFCSVKPRWSGASETSRWGWRSPGPRRRFAARRC